MLGKLGSSDALEVIARFRGRDGGQLPPDMAAVELLNILRPTVAVHRYVTFAALALHQYPATRRAGLALRASRRVVLS